MPTKPLKISRIVVDRDLCIGCATCTVLAPDTFQMDEEGKSTAANLESTDAETTLAAAESCPTKAIFLYDEDGVLIYPYA
jgi:ferredoxin